MRRRSDPADSHTNHRRGVQMGRSRGTVPVGGSRRAFSSFVRNITAMKTIHRMGRCLATLTLLFTLDGALNAQSVTHYSWQEPHAKVLPTGDLEWAPQAFEFKAGDSVRYIDF